MKEKINVAKLLKDCPSGMELDCMMYENLYFNSLNADYDGTINCYTLIDGIKTSIDFSKYGTFNSHKGAKCVIFPKGKTTWEGFHRPFKDGDIVATNDGTWIGITTGGMNGIPIPTYCVIGDGKFEAYHSKRKSWSFDRLATEEEKQRLFQAIEDNGFKWNAETKTLEKFIEPKFKVGDRIVDKLGLYSPTLIKSVSDEYYGLELPNGIGVMSVKDQDDWELVPDKFDITTLKPFDKVLVRDNNGQKWTADLFSLFDKSLIYPYSCVGHYTNQCIPYEGNENLLGTSNDCDDFYKTWEN